MLSQAVCLLFPLISTVDCMLAMESSGTLLVGVALRFLPHRALCPKQFPLGV